MEPLGVYVVEERSGKTRSLSLQGILGIVLRLTEARNETGSRIRSLGSCRLGDVIGRT